jgi:hypothetical protein
VAANIVLTTTRKFCAFFKTIKAELVWRRTWATRRKAETIIFQYINGF